MGDVTLGDHEHGREGGGVAPQNVNVEHFLHNAQGHRTHPVRERATWSGVADVESMTPFESSLALSFAECRAHGRTHERVICAPQRLSICASLIGLLTNQDSL